MATYLFLPKNAAPPYQTSVYHPGGDALLSQSALRTRKSQTDAQIVTLPTSRGFARHPGRTRCGPGGHRSPAYCVLRTELGREPTASRRVCCWGPGVVRGAGAPGCLWGAPEQDKRIVLYEASHLPANLQGLDPRDTRLAGSAGGYRWDAIGAQYSTEMRNNPRAGAVGPGAMAQPGSRRASTPGRSTFPLPVSSRTPTMFRTMCFRNPLPVTR